MGVFLAATSHLPPSFLCVLRFRRNVVKPYVNPLLEKFGKADADTNADAEEL